MGNIEKNGIVSLEDMLQIHPSGLDSYSREEDIIPSGDIDSKSVNIEGKDDDNKVGENILDDNHVDNPADKEGGADKKDENDLNPDINDNVNKNIEQSVDYKGILGSLSDRGVFPGLRDVKFATEDGKELSFDEIEIGDKDSFIDMISSIIENQKEDLVADKIDVKSVSDFTKKLIQADKSGANILDILKQYDKTSAPVENLSIDNKADQLKIIRHYISLLGLPKDEEDDYFKGIVERGDDFIEAKAMRYKSELNKKMNNIIAERTKAAEEKRAKDAEDFRNYKKSFKASLNERYQLNESAVSKVMNFATGRSKDNPKTTEALETVTRILKDPQKAPDLIMFLMNPDEFIKQKSNIKVNNEKKRIYRMMSNTGKSRVNSPIDDKGNMSEGMDFEEIELKDNYN